MKLLRIAIIVRLKFQKQNVLKFVSRTIPHSGGYNTPELTAKLFPKLALGFISVILAAVFLATNVLAAEKLLTIIHTNDLHSHFQGFSPEIDYKPLVTGADETLGGWSRIATVIKRTKLQKTNPVLVLDAGDFTMGSLFHMLIREEAFELRLLKAMGYDAITLGNHEFDLKPAGLAAILKTAKAKGGMPQIVFAGAIFDKNNPVLTLLENAFRDANVKDYTIMERDGLKIGIFGILGKDAVSVSPFAKPLTFREPIEVARETVNVLRNQEKVDVVICLSHGGLNKNPKKSEDEMLAREVKGIDVIVSGHTHTKLDKPILVGETIIVQSWAYGKQVGILDIAYTDGKVSLKNYSVTPINAAVEGDRDIQKIIEEYKQILNAQFLAGKQLSYDKIIARTKWDMIIDARESPLGNMLADSIRWYVNMVDSDKNDPASRVVVAVESGGVIRDHLLAGKTGHVTVGDLFRTIPLGIGADDTMGYPLISFYLYGYELKRALEILTSVQPLKGPDYFLQISGLRFTYNPHRVIFDRVTHIDIGSEEEGYQPLDYSKSSKRLYRVAANIYNATFLKVVGNYTYHFLDIEPKDKNGNPVEKLADARVDADKSKPGIQELKEWQGVIKYVQSFPDTDGDGLSSLPEKYRGPLGRIVAKPSFSPINLVAGGTLPTRLAVVIVGFMLSIIVICAILIGVRRKAGRGRRLKNS